MNMKVIREIRRHGIYGRDDNMVVNDNYKQALQDLITARDNYQLADEFNEPVLYHRMKEAEERVIMFIKEGKAVDNNRRA